MMDPTNADRVRELLSGWTRSPPVLLGKDALRPSLEDGEAALSSLDANLRTLCQAARLAYCIARNPAPAAQIICKVGLDATEADNVRQTLALGHEIAQDVTALLAGVNKLFGRV
jgi:hypothetical protein